jgi:hypothetical protein
LLRRYLIPAVTIRGVQFASSRLRELHAISLSAVKSSRNCER